MTDHTDLLQSIEQRANRAIYQELRLMTKEVLQLRPQLREDVRERLDVLPHYVVVLDATGRRVYSSPALNRVVPPVPDTDLGDYYALCQRRFANPSLRFPFRRSALSGASPSVPTKPKAVRIIRWTRRSNAG